ncbi:MAG TPA: CHAD domain-containing protein [Solirubrobacterales bacterium]
MKARRVKKLDPEKPLRKNARRIVRTRLKELCSLAEPALDPSAAEAQHDLRIACKRLRYVLDLVGSCFGEEAGIARDRARELQTVLGEIHDCDEMLPRAEGIASLDAFLRTRRELLYRRFVDLWRADSTAATWEAVERILDD